MVFSMAVLGTAMAVEVPHERFSLDNGLDVILIEDHRLPQVVVDVWYGVGSFDDPPEASGFAHLFEHLMFKGTEVVPAFDPLMEANGGANNATTGNDRTNYFSWGSSNILELLLFLEADRMTGLQITQEKLDMEREVVRNELRQNYEDSPYGGVWLALPEMLFPPEHPYSLEGIGSHEDLMNASLEHVQNFYASWYAPNNARLAVAGDFESEVLRPRIEELFGSLQPAIVPSHTAVSEVREVQQRRQILEDQVPSPALVMAWHSPSYFSQGDAELDVLANILAGHAAARLDARLVYGEGQALQTWVGQLSAKRGSTFLVWIQAEPGADLSAIEAVVAEEIAGIAGENPATEDELAIALNNREMSFLTNLEGLLERAEALQSYAFYVGDNYGPAQDIERYKGVTAESLKAVIEEWLSPDNVAVIEVHPKEAAQADEESEP
ncbi:MAG: pitrilysin family protein [Myxococcota bacterium]|nr:pitrilysin family protein [Myxococcota bacterium]